MDSITRRFVDVCDYFKVNKIVKNDAQIARDIGVVPSAMSNIMKGSSKAELKIIYGVAKAYPDINVKWLLTGEGDMILKEECHEINMPNGNVNYGTVEARLQAIEYHVKQMNDVLFELIKSELENKPSHSKILKILANLDNERKKKRTGTLSK